MYRIEAFLISALVAPGGQEMLAQKQVLVCWECGTPMGEGGKKDEIPPHDNEFNSP